MNSCDKTIDSSAGRTLEGIRYLRGMAAIMVVFHHSITYFGSIAGWPRFGETGVDIFFVISGFIMAYATADSRQAHLPALGHAADFVIKRLVRVVPLYWLALLWDYRHDFAHGHVTAHAFEDFIFVPHYHDYWTTAVAPGFYQGWTVNYEIFFYLVFALAMLAGRYALYAVGIAMATLALIGVTHSFHLAPAVFYTSSQILEFVFGIGLYLFMLRVPRSLPNAMLVGMLTVAVAMLALHDESTGVLADAIPALLVVYTFIGLFNGTRSGILALLGDASYCIYLFHLDALPFARHLIEFWNVNALPHPLNIGMIFFLQITAAVALGVVVHLMLEKPLLAWLKRRIAAPRNNRADNARVETA